MNVKAVVFDAPGAPNVLKVINIQLADPAPNEVRIKHTAIEVNFLDIKQRQGSIPFSDPSRILGCSAVGEIEKIGSNVKGFRIGDRVAYATARSGAYCEARNINADLVFKLALDPSEDIAACALVKGLTAHYLLFRTFAIRAGIQILIHSAGSGVGKLMAQWARTNGVYVIGTVGSEERRQAALDAGCEKVINYKTEDLVAKVMQYTNNIGVNAVYDGVGKDTFDRSLDCLMPMGIMILYGQSSGSVETLNISKIAAKSLFFTRPSLFDYKSSRMELLLSVHDVFTAINDGILTIDSPKRYRLEDAAKAHEALEDRLHKTSVILVP